MANPIPFVLSPEERAAAEAKQAEDDAKIAAYWGGQSTAGPAMSVAPPNASFAPPPTPTPSVDVSALPAAPPTAPTGRRPAPALDAQGKPIDVASEFKPGDVVAPGDDTRVSKALAGVRPTPQENAQLASVKAPPKASAGVGGAPANADPYGLKAATNKVLGTYDTQAAATRAIATGEADKAHMMAEHQVELSRRQQEDAAIASAEEDIAAQHFDAQMTELQAQLDDVRAKKIDPYKRFKEEPALAVSAVIGGVLGGLYMGATHGQENPFIRDLNRQIDRQVGIEEKELDRQSGAIGQSLTLLGQQRQIHRDNQAAKLATRNLYYEATKNQILAEAAQYDSPLYQARADEAVSHIEREQGGLEMKLAEAKRAQAQAVGAQAMAQRKEILATYRSVYDKVLESTGSPATAESEANRQLALMYAPGTAGPRPAGAATANPLGSVPKELRNEAAKEWEAHAGAEKGLGSLAQSFDDWRKLPLTAGPWDRQREAIQANIIASYKLALGPGMSSDKDAEKFLDPLRPALGDSDETLKQKQALIERTIRGKVPTPILDSTVPNWKPQPVQRYDEKGAPKK